MNTWTVLRSGAFTAFPSRGKAREVMNDLASMFPHSKYSLVQCLLEEELKASDEIPESTHVNSMGDSLLALLQDRDRAVHIEIHPGKNDERGFTVTISDGEFQGVGTSAWLDAAIQGARMKLKEARDELVPVMVPREAITSEAPKPKLSAVGLKIKK